MGIKHSCTRQNQGKSCAEQLHESTSSHPLSVLSKPNLVPNHTPSKTHTVQKNPKVTMSVTPNVTPIQPKPIATSPQQLTPTPTLIQTTAANPSNPSPTTQKKQNMLVGIQSLGAITVTIENGQLIVHGPDHAAATQISQLLLTGAAKLANLNGKQVLLTTAPANAGKQQTDKDGEDPDKTSSGEPENAEEKHSQKTPDPEKRCWKCKISDEEAELSKCHGCYRVRYKFSNIALSRIFSRKISHHKRSILHCWSKYI